MKLLRFGEPGRERPGILDANGVVRDLSAHLDDLAGSSLSPESLATIRALDATTLPAVPAPVRIGPCVSRVGKIVCVGRNYAEHVRETGRDLPTEPVLFMKATTSITAPDGPIMLPRDSSKTDWEVELACVIGRRARYVEESRALEHVAGYAVFNDVSEREFQLERGGQWDKGKSCDTFAPIGPWLVTPDEIPDLERLQLTLKLNDEIKQHASTEHMIFRVPVLISYISRFMTLEPGDVIATGTPGGVGLGHTPPLYLKAGDVLELEIDRLGRQRQTVVPFAI